MPNVFTRAAQKLFPSLFGVKRKGEQALYPQTQAIWGGMTFRTTGEHPRLTSTDQLRAYKHHIYKAVSTISADIAALEVQLKRARGGEERQVDDHPLLELLERPAPMWTGNLLRQTLELHLSLTGNAFTYVERARDGTPTALHPLYPNRVVIVPSETMGILGYLYQSLNGRMLAFLPDEVLHVRFASAEEPFWGMSPVAALGFTPEISSSLRYYVRQFIANDARPDFLIAFKEKVEIEHLKALQALWRENHEGAQKAGGVAFLDNEARPHPISSPLKDLEIATLDEWALEDVISTFNTPKAVLGLVSDTNRANMDAAIRTYQQRALAPRATLWTKQWLKPLLAMYPGSQRLDITLENPVPGDRIREYTESLGDLKAGAQTVRQHLMRIGAPGANDAPDVYLVPSNVRIMTTLEETEASLSTPNAAPAQPQAPPGEPPDDTAARSRRIRAWTVQYRRDQERDEFDRTTALHWWTRETGSSETAHLILGELEALVRARGLVDATEHLKGRGAKALARALGGNHAHQ
jgi:HK97 family phage portal protein